MLGLCSSVAQWWSTRLLTDRLEVRALSEEPYLVIMRFKVTPVSIPNTKVKLLEADGTAWETVWESKWLPGLYGSLAQSVEHMTFNHGVRGSIPR